MMVDKIKEELNNHLGKKITIKYNLGRNKYEKYDVTLKELYNHVFLVQLDNKIVKSFSYSDVISKTIKINY